MQTPNPATAPLTRSLALKKASLALSVASWCGLIASVLLAIPAVQSLRSTGLGDRTTVAMESILYLLPLVIFVAWVSLLTIRIRSRSRIANYSAFAHGLATLTFTFWLVTELFY